MRYNFKIPAALVFSIIVTLIVRALTYDVDQAGWGLWWPTVVAMFGSLAAFYAAHLAGWLDFLDRSD